MNRRRASSSFSNPESKRRDLSLNIVIDDVHDLLLDGPLSPLTPLEESPEDSLGEVPSIEEVLPSSKWHRRMEDGWLLPGEDEDDLCGPMWNSKCIKLKIKPKGILTLSTFHIIEEEPPVKTRLPKQLTKTIHRINDNIIRDWTSKDATDPLLPYFLANGNAFYYNLFMPAMMEELKAEQRGKIQGSNAKKLQETIDVGTIGLARKHGYHY